LAYRQYGGSGLGLSYNDVLEMDLTEALWFLNKLKEVREHEAETLSKTR
jgi:hypothetical protein